MHDLRMAEPSEFKGGSSTVLDLGTHATDKGTKRPSKPGIRCPLCGWQPPKLARWMCKCRYIWNTFDTGGVCRDVFISGR